MDEGLGSGASTRPATATEEAEWSDSGVDKGWEVGSAAGADSAQVVGGGEAGGDGDAGGPDHQTAPVQSQSSAGLAVPPHFQCPVSMELMVDPVMVATGHTYDRPCIQRWLEQGHKTCPVTGGRLRHLELIPNFALRSAIQEWAAANGRTMKERQLTSVTEKAVFHVRDDDTVDPTSTSASMADAPAPIPHCVLEAHEEIVWAVEATEGHLFSASADKTIRVWNTETRRCVHVLEEHTRPVLSLVVSQRHGKLFSGSYDCSIRVWDLTTFRRVRSLHGHTDAVRSLAVAGDTLFSGSYDSTLRAYDIATLKPLRVMEGHTGPVRTLAVLGGCLFSGSYDKSVRVWDTATLESLAVLQVGDWGGAGHSHGSYGTHRTALSARCVVPHGGSAGRPQALTHDDLLSKPRFQLAP